LASVGVFSCPRSAAWASCSRSWRLTVMVPLRSSHRGLLVQTKRPGYAARSCRRRGAAGADGPVGADVAAAPLGGFALQPAVTDEQVEHVAGVLLLLGQDALDHHPGDRVLLAEVARQFTVVLDRDALGDQVLADHRLEVIAGLVLGRRARGQRLRIEVGRAAQL